MALNGRRVGGVCLYFTVHSPLTPGSCMAACLVLLSRQEQSGEKKAWDRRIDWTLMNSGAVWHRQGDMPKDK